MGELKNKPLQNSKEDYNFMKLRKFFFLMISLVLLTAIVQPLALAAPLSQNAVACEQEVVVQADDWLSKIADKVYGDVFAYPAIADATNAKHAEDDTFASIENVDVIEVGWKLCAPSAADAETLLQRALAAPEVAMSPAEPSGQQVGRLVLATTTSTYDSGLLDVILPDFEAKYGAEVEVIAVGTGQAIQLGENGDADVILVHARSREDAFVGGGFGVNRQDVMYNDFVIVGPAADPAGIKGLTDVAAALTKIAETQSPFISRGDDSGTHTKEQSLWQATNVPLTEAASISSADKTFVRPEGEWYQSIGQGMGATLTVANEQLAYTLSDRATFLARKQEGLDLEIVVEGDSRLFNPYGVIAVNPELHPTVNFAGAQAFIDWLTSVETQQLISQFGVDTFGQPLFVPDSALWNAAKK
jgi:tungstate transport system substrate-binding protein